MQITGHITADSLMSLETYAKARRDIRAQVINHRRLRSVRLGEHLNLQFEDDEFNFVKVRAQHGTKRAFEMRDEYFDVPEPD